MYFKNKRILITAGPTWVPIDGVRVISNIASGETGVLLAEKLCRRGAKVTLVLGPVVSCCMDKRIKLVRFKFFDELKYALIKEIKGSRPDIIVHSAAVSDYRVKKVYRGKVKSGFRGWRLNLKPAPKIINVIRRLSPASFLIGFKFELGSTKDNLIRQANRLLKTARLDLVVANTVQNNRYRSFILYQKKEYGPFSAKSRMAGELIRIMELTRRE